MKLVEWTPFSELEDLANRYGRLFEDRRWPLQGRYQLLGTGIDWTPAADIIERDDEYLIKADLPEVKREDVEVTLENSILTLKGERRMKESKEDDKQLRVESYYGSFSRSFHVPEDVEISAIRAESKDGVLRVHLPKTSVKKKADPVTIAIR